MNIVIYNINSFGGNHEYARELLKAYRANSDVSSVVCLMPENSPERGDGVKHLLVKDKSDFKNKVLRKFDYIFKGIINPVKLFSYLKRREKSHVIFNDYDQLTSLVWVPLLKLLKKKHTFSVVLHDPDRDMFLPKKWMSEFTMKKVMSLMDIAFHHGYLPERSYYSSPIKKIAVPHGLYPVTAASETFIQNIKALQNLPYILGIIGNIRDEKNYEFILRALPSLPDCHLLVAGSKANSGVPVEKYQQLIQELNIQNQVIWVERYLDEDELNAAICVSDIVLLYYKVSFTSQSGILNNIAPYSKKLLATDTPSSLRETVRKYQIGELVKPEDKAGFIETVNRLNTLDKSAFDAAWSRYREEATWSKHVEVVLKHIKNL